MPDVGTPSLDQLQVFLVVVETGSFAAAARRLGRATSAISYTIANLETQLGIALFDRERTRKTGPHRSRHSGAVKSPHGLGRGRRPAREREGSAQRFRAQGHTRC